MEHGELWVENLTAYRSVKGEHFRQGPPLIEQNMSDPIQQGVYYPKKTDSKPLGRSSSVWNSRCRLHWWSNVRLLLDSPSKRSRLEGWGCGAQVSGQEQMMMMMMMKSLFIFINLQIFSYRYFFICRCKFIIRYTQYKKEKVKFVTKYCLLE